VIVAQVSDTHIALDTPDKGQRFADFAAVIADINALDPLPDLIVHTGDIVHNGLAAEYGEACAILHRAKAPVYVVAGNKDNRAELRAAFAADGYLAPEPGFVQYAVEEYPLRLVVLDTLCTDSNKGDYCERRLDELHRLIEAAPPRPVAVFLHHPPFEVLVGPERMHFEREEAMAGLREALCGSGRVVAIFCGHVHRPTEGLVGEIPAKVATAAATTLRKGDYPERFAGRPIYYLHKLDSSGILSTEARATGGYAQD